MLSIELSAVCTFSTEEKASSQTTTTKTVFDYTEIASTTTYPAIKQHSWVNAANIPGGWGATDSRGCWGGNSGQLKKEGETDFIYIYFATCKVLYYYCNSGDSLNGTTCTTSAGPCPQGYSSASSNTSTGNTVCVKQVSYNYVSYTCNANDKNSQGFGWGITAAPTSDGTKIDNYPSSITNLTGTVYSHTTRPSCKRKYQECTIDCDSPLVYNATINKCVISYKNECIQKGMVYNSAEHKCEVGNQCGDPSAERDSHTGRCVAIPSCHVEDSICTEDVNKLCENLTFSYSDIYDKCIVDTACYANQYVLDDGRCGGTPFCNLYDLETEEECVNTVEVTKSCSPDSRESNLCYAGNQNSTTMDIDYHRPLLKGEFNGEFRESNMNSLLGIPCSADGEDCEFRLTKIFTKEEGKQICFQDAQGAYSCIEIRGSCKFSGSFENASGIKQLKIEKGNRIVGYNLNESPVKIGEISSTCQLSGKVGNFEGEYVGSDITSAAASGSDIKFWDKYQRGFIGVISLLPTIPSVDLADGFTYEDGEVYELINKGFTAFYSEDNSSVYAVYNGYISKTDCQSLISNTSFYIPQAENEAEASILRGLNYKSKDTYNYSDSDLVNGSCVIKSQSARSFNNQEFSVKNTSIPDSSSIFVCSPFQCSDHSCQYNQCPTHFSPNLYDSEYFDRIYYHDFPNSSAEEVCTTDICDANKPYFRYCGNKFGCESEPNVYQQSDGSCVTVECASDEQLDLATGKCTSYGCLNSIEKGGKCYKTLH